MPLSSADPYAHDWRMKNALLGSRRRCKLETPCYGVLMVASALATQCTAILQLLHGFAWCPTKSPGCEAVRINNVSDTCLCEILSSPHARSLEGFWWVLVPRFLTVG